MEAVSPMIHQYLPADTQTDSQLNGLMRYRLLTEKKPTILVKIVEEWQLLLWNQKKWYFYDYKFGRDKVENGL